MCMSMHPPCIVLPKGCHAPCILRASFGTRTSAACILRALFSTRISTACILRASFGTSIFTFRGSTPYGCYIIIKAGGGGWPGRRRPLGIVISIVPTDVFQTGSATRGMLQHEPRRQTNENRNPKGRQAPLIAD